MKRWRKFLLAFCLILEQGSAQVTFTQLEETCGTDITLRCSFQGVLNPSLTRSWLKGETIILSGGASVSGRYREVTNSNYFDLIVTNFTSLDEDTYRCLYGFDRASGLVSCTARTTTTTTSEIVAQVSEEGDELSGGAIAGIVIGSILGAAVISVIIAGIIYYIRRQCL